MYGTKRKIKTFLSALLIALCLIPFNIIMQRYYLRVDCTAEQRFTLSAGSREIVDQLEKPVIIRFYQSENIKHADNFVRLKVYGDHVNDLLNELAIYAEGKIKIERFVNFKPSSRGEDAARYDLIQALPVSGRDYAFFGISIIREDRKQLIPYLDPNHENMLEYKLMRGIQTLIQGDEKSKTVGVMSDLPIMGKKISLSTTSTKWLFIQELEKDYVLKAVPMDSREIPEGLDVLLIYHPRGISKSAQYAIDQYLMRGGKVICFVDPWHALGKRNVNHSALPDLFKAWGVGYDHTKVLVDPGLATTTSAGEKDARMVTLGREQINRNSTVIGGLNQLFLIFSGAFHVTKVPGIDVQPLIESSRHAQVFDLLKVRLQGKRILAEMNQNKETSKVHALALSMKGDFSTAFPKGEPEYEVKGEGKIPPPPEKAHQKKSDGKGAVLLVADSDLLEDRVWVKQIRHPHSKELVNKITYDNATLLFNALEYYMGSTSLQTVRSRAVSLPRFTVVRDMEIEARRKFDDKVMALREEREAKEAFLRQYNEGIMLSPSQLQELDTYHKKLADIIREEKNLEREINRNINALGNRLMWLNIAAVPAFIMLLGLGIGLWRRFF